MMVVTHEGGVKFVANVRGHRVETDQPTRAGGEDSAPMPLEMMGVALGTCVALYVQQFCNARGIPHEGMRVEVEMLGAPNPNRVGRFDLRVVLPEAVPEKYRDAIDRVARSCAVHNTLMHAPEMTVRVEEEEAAAA
ncbi:MAG: OsmC family protein [Gemmatimonadota bacterium]